MQVVIGSVNGALVGKMMMMILRRRKEKDLLTDATNLARVKQASNDMIERRPYKIGIWRIYIAVVQRHPRSCYVMSSLASTIPLASGPDRSPCRQCKVNSNNIKVIPCLFLALVSTKTLQQKNHA